MRRLFLAVLTVVLLAPTSAAAAPIPFGPIGDQSRLSQTGANDNADLTAGDSEVAYSSGSDRYLAVWAADRHDGENEVYGKVLDGAGQPLTEALQLTNQGPGGDPTFDATSPALAYNAEGDEFLLVWQGSMPGPDGSEIFARRISPAGELLGSQDQRASDTGPPAAAPSLTAQDPQVAWNGDDDEYLVTWDADDVNNNHTEIHAQRLSASNATEVGTDDIQVSDTGPNETGSTSVFDPKPVYNANEREYLVAWKSPADEATNFGAVVRVQRLASDGTPRGSDPRVSDIGQGNAVSAFHPDVALDPMSGRYLVAWSGVDSADEEEVEGRLLESDADPVGSQLPLSDAGPAGDTEFTSEAAEVVYNPSAGEFLVLWHAEESVNTHFEIYGQRVKADGSQAGENDFQVSSTGGDDNNADVGAFTPAAALNTAAHEYVVSWESNPGASAGLAADKFEVFSRRVADGAGVAPDPPVAGDPQPQGGQQTGGQQPPPGPLAGDLTPPILRLARTRSQRVLRRNAVTVTATADENSLYTAKGTVAVPGGGARTVRLTGARTRTGARKATLKLRLPRKQRAVLARAFQRRRSLKATITVTARNSTGLTRTRRVTVKLVP